MNITSIGSQRFSRFHSRSNGYYEFLPSGIAQHLLQLACIPYFYCLFFVILDAFRYQVEGRLILIFSFPTIMSCVLRFPAIFYFVVFAVNVHFRCKWLRISGVTAVYVNFRSYISYISKDGVKTLWIR